MFVYDRWAVHLCFELVSLFEASRSLAQEFDLAESELDEELTEADVPLLRLHQHYAFVQASKTLLQLSLLVRTYDDQMRESDRAAEYEVHLKEHDDGHYVGILHGSDEFPMREACNKIIHAREVLPLYERVDRVIMDALPDGTMGQDIWFLTGEIELNGKRFGKDWHAVLLIQPFIEVVLAVVEFGDP